MISSASRLLITGATGFIGSRLALFANHAGIDVVATGRVANESEHTRYNDLRAAGVKIVSGDLQRREFVRSVLEGRTKVIHLAAAQHEAHLPDSYFRATNVDATALLLEESRKAAIQRFVYGSTIGVYGTQPGPLDETSPTRPDNIYGATKLEAELAVRRFDQDLQTCIVRISETYGPGDLRLLKLFQAIDRGRFAMIGDGANRRQLIHVADLVRGLLIAGQHPAAVGETFVFAGREVLTTAEMIAAIARALGRDPPRRRLPLWPFATAAVVLETTLRPLRIQPPLHRRRLDFFRKSFTFSTAKAHTLIGFRAETEFRAGATDAANWYRSRGRLQRRMTNAVAGANSA
jgi:nucleoside-diphosphate-sugar epimerase